MDVSQVGNSVNVPTDNSKFQAQVKKILNANSTNANANVKKDSVILSEKAKDLAAQQAGKSFQEEQKETQTAKLKES